MKFVRFTERNAYTIKVHFIPVNQIVSIYFDGLVENKVFIKLTNGDDLCGNFALPNNAELNAFKAYFSLEDFKSVFKQITMETDL